MWNLVSSLQQTLDDAAGINTTVQQQNITTAGHTAPLPVPQHTIAGNGGGSGDVQPLRQGPTGPADSRDEGRHTARAEGSDGTPLVAEADVGSKQQVPLAHTDINQREARETPEPPAVRRRRDDKQPAYAASPAEVSAPDVPLTTVVDRPVPSSAAARDIVGSGRPVSPTPASAARSVGVSCITTETTVLVADGGAVPSAPATASNAALEAQLLRLQQHLLDETTLRAAAEGRLDEAQQRSRQLLQQQAATQSAAAAEGDAVLRDKITLLEREGVQLSEELGHERTRSRGMASEKRALEKKIEELVATVGEMTGREKQLVEQREAALRLDAASREKVAALQASVLQLSNELAGTSAELGQAQLAIFGHSQAASDTDRHAKEEVLAQRETYELRHAELTEALDRSKAELRRSLVEHELRLSMLERELAQANLRAHAAESRALDAHRHEHASAQVVMTQYQQDAANVTRIAAQLALKTKECQSLTVQLAAVQQAVSELENATTGKSLKHLTVLEAKEKELREARSAVDREVHLRACVMQRLQTAEGDLAAAVAKAARLEQQQQQQVHDMPTAAANSAPAPAGTTAVNGASHVVDVGKAAGTATGGLPSAMSPGLPAAPSSAAASGGGGGATRVEKELMRLSVELQRLRGVEHRHDKVRGQLITLTHQHDVLLQMYGQLQEELSNARNDCVEGKVAYQAQLDVLSRELEAVRRQ